MLTPEQLAYCADDMIKLYSQLEEDIVRDVARRIAKTGYLTDTGIWQANALQEIGVLHSDILSSVAQYSGQSEETLKKLFEDAAVTATEYDNEIYRANGLNPKSIKVSASQMQVLEAGYKKTNGNLSNLTRTTAITSQTSFINACSLAELKTTSGAFTYEQAITDAVKQIAADGAFVLYPSGHRDHIDVAVRRNVMTGLGQTTGEICLANANELGCDLMEITAHCGARPSHAQWQGQIVSLSGRRGYLSLSDIGYGTGDGFKGWNCRHDWYPYFEGSTRMYSAKDLKELNARNIEYSDGTMHTQYEAEQHQRACERKIRETKRVLAAQDEFINNTTSEPLKRYMQNDFDKASVKLKRQKAELKKFCKQTDIIPDNLRSQVYSFSRSTAQKAVQADKRKFANLANNKVVKSSKNGIIKSLDVDDFNIMASSNDILPEVSDVIINTIKKFENPNKFYLFDTVYDVVNSKSLFETDLNNYGLPILRINKSKLSGKTLAEVNEMIKNTSVNLPQTLEEAVIHEIGHGKAYHGKNAKQIVNMNNYIKNKGVKRISPIAEDDGAECIAEVEVLLYRNSKIPPKAKLLYNLCIQPDKVKYSTKKYYCKGLSKI